MVWTRKITWHSECMRCHYVLITLSRYLPRLLRVITMVTSSTCGLYAYFNINGGSTFWVRPSLSISIVNQELVTMQLVLLEQQALFDTQVAIVLVLRRKTTQQRACCVRLVGRRSTNAKDVIIRVVRNYCPADTIRWINVVLPLVQRLLSSGWWLQWTRTKDVVRSWNMPLITSALRCPHRRSRGFSRHCACKHEALYQHWINVDDKLFWAANSWWLLRDDTHGGCWGTILLVAAEGRYSWWLLRDDTHGGCWGTILMVAAEGRCSWWLLRDDTHGGCW